MSAITQTAFHPSFVPNGSGKVHGSEKAPQAWVPTESWKPLNHPRADEVCQENDQYFLQYWPFPNEKSRVVFRKAGFGRVTCLYFPLARDDRILYACRLLTILFLIDGKVLQSLARQGANAADKTFWRTCRLLTARRTMRS